VDGPTWSICVIAIDRTSTPKRFPQEWARLMQLLPQTAAQLGVRMFSIARKHRGGTRYLKDMLCAV